VNSSGGILAARGGILAARGGILATNTIVLVPTLNEAGAIGQTIEDIQRYAPACRIVVIDSHSTDGTQGIAAGKGATVTSAPRGGKGLALRSALPDILHDYPDYYYIMLDGDFTYPAKHIPAIIAALDKGADTVIGYRTSKEKGSMTQVNRIGNWGLSMLCWVYGVRVRDLCSGMWGFKGVKLTGFYLTSDRFTLEADLFVNAVKNKCRLAQIPIGYRARADSGRTKLKMSDGFRIAWFLVCNRIY
jgi:dolichol-phosphate mannosyltransferase